MLSAPEHITESKKFWDPRPPGRAPLTVSVDAASFHIEISLCEPGEPCQQIGFAS